MSKEQQIEERYEMAEIIAKHSHFRDETWDASDYEWAAHCLQEAGYRRQSEWISVEERLPERNGRYLTHCNIENQSLVCVLYYCKIGGFNEGTVTHWMPLPEPPKMKGGAG